MQWPSDSRYMDLVQAQDVSLLRIAYALTGSRVDAEDAVQEALIATALRWPPRTKGSELAYLRKTVANKCFDIIRARRKEFILAELPDSATDDDGLLKFESHQQITALIRKLPPRQQSVIVLRFVAQLDDQMISQILSCQKATVRSLAHRALATLREEWKVEHIHES